MALEPSVPRTLRSCLLAASVWCIPGPSPSHAAVAPGSLYLLWLGLKSRSKTAESACLLPARCHSHPLVAGWDQVGSKVAHGDGGQGFLGVRTLVGKVGALEPTRNFLCPSHRRQSKLTLVSTRPRLDDSCPSTVERRRLWGCALGVSRPWGVQRFCTLSSTRERCRYRRRLSQPCLSVPALYPDPCPGFKVSRRFPLASRVRNYDVFVLGNLAQVKAWGMRKRRILGRTPTLSHEVPEGPTVYWCANSLGTKEEGREGKEASHVF